MALIGSGNDVYLKSSSALIMFSYPTVNMKIIGGDVSVFYNWNS